jgi:hypothetical protein
MIAHNLIVVVIAAVVAFLLGGLWYSPLLFAKAWVAAHGYTPEKVAQMKKDAPKAYAISFLCQLVMAAVLAMLLLHLGATTWKHGAFWAAHIWLGFAATIGLMAHVYSDRKLAVFVIDSGYQLLYLVVMGAIIGGWAQH